MRTGRLQRVRLPRWPWSPRTAGAVLAALYRQGMLGHLKEILLVAGAYFAYMYTRKLVFSDVEVQAFVNAFKLVDFQKAAGIFWEVAIQKFILDHAQPLVYALNWMYIITFWPIVGVTAIFFYIKDRRTYRAYRNVVLLSFVIAMLVFMAFPLAPPRMLSWEGFVDTVKNYGPAFYSNREAQSYFNAFAAMPSIHFAWTVLFGILFWRTGLWWMRVLAPLYPTMTLLAIVGTANHYLMDAAGGLFVAITSMFIYRYIISGKPLEVSLFAGKKGKQAPAVEEKTS